MSKTIEDAPVRTLDPGRLDSEDRKLLLDQVVVPTDRDGRPLRQEIRARLDRHVAWQPVLRPLRLCEEWGVPFHV